MHPYLNNIRPSGYLLQLSDLHPPFKLRKQKKKALVIHGNSLVGCLCLILHDMIVHTPLEELQTSVLCVNISDYW